MPDLITHSPQKTVARGSVAIYKKYLGRGPENAKTTITEDFVATILSDSMTLAERSLVEAGERETVRQLRRKFQDAMRAEMIALAEEATGRRVSTFLSDHDVDADRAVEMMVFAPRA